MVRSLADRPFNLAPNSTSWSTDSCVGSAMSSDHTCSAPARSIARQSTSKWSSRAASCSPMSGPPKKAVTI